MVTTSLTASSNGDGLAKPLPESQVAIVILPQGQPLPAGTMVLGEVKISDSGYSINCSYRDVLTLALEQSRKAGGNAIQIMEHQKPNFWSTCHRIKAAMLLIKPSDPEQELKEATRKAKLAYDSLVAVNSDTAKFVFVERHPVFPGGDQAFMKFLSSNVKYPQEAKKEGIAGTTVIEFVIAENGEATDGRIIKSLSPEIDQEMLRLLSIMPRWTPGFQNAKPVKVKYTLPMRFGLNNKSKSKG